MVNIHPKKLSGEWDKGFALDVHTLSSTFIGHNEFGHPQFENEYSEMGELLFRLKYRSDKSVLPSIMNTASAFITQQRFPINLVVPVPPSKTRTYQPVMVIAKNIASRLKAPICTDCIVKTKDTPELKNVYDFDERLKLLKNAYTVNKSILSRKKILLFDDLYRSGATLNAITKALYEKGGAAEIYVVTLTKTRSTT